ncbi:MAG: VOC family protein [Verrucomicrobia bacterium]|nr:VOC family protein [Verrucomicrobiota bacterium]
MKIVEFAFTGYPVTDLERARKFYEGVLGLKLANIWPMGPDKAWVEYEVGPHVLAITNVADEWKPHRSGPALAFEVEDYDTAIAELKAAGATVYLDTVNTGVCHFAVISDPDGNSFMIHKRNPDRC